MTQFRVWAPKVKKVELDLNASLVDMERNDDGWWSVDIDLKDMEIEYAYRVDGFGPIPDPRSQFQPHGVLGPSRTVRHDRFKWTDQSFCTKPLSSGIIYELHIGTFTPEGTFDSAVSQLDHLVNLGVTHVEIMPICEFPGKRGWGYDGVDLYAVHHHYGGPEGFKRLVNACHERGLSVILDVVYNHVGPTGNFLDRFGPYFMEKHPGQWGQPFNLSEPHSDEVRRFFIDNMKMWLRDYHVDGLRLDAVHAIVDNSALHILEELNEEAEQVEAHLGRPVIMIAESDLNDPRMIRSRDAHGFGFHAQWIDDFHHSLHAYLTGQTTGYFTGYGTLEALAHTMTKGFYFARTFCPHRDRVYGRPSTGLSAHRFIGFLQNHDQVGNRYEGDRSAHFITLGQARIAAAIVLTGPFIPMLFMGEEWGASTPFLYFTDHEDPELARAVSIGRQKDFEKIGWDHEKVPDPQDPATMEKSKLRWDELAHSPHKELLEWHRLLIQLRKRYSDLVDGRMENMLVDYDEGAQWMLYQRGRVTVVVNFSKEQRLIPLKPMTVRDVLGASEDEVRILENQVLMPAESAVILGPETP